MRMKIVSIALVSTFIGSAPTLASDKDDVLAIMNQFKDHGNKLNERTESALCVDQTVIIDMFPPFNWSGDGASSAWIKAGDAYGKEHGIADGVVSFENAPRIFISEDRAYAGMPTTFTYKVNGKPAAEPIRSIWTYTLQKRPVGWRITGLIWGLK